MTDRELMQQVLEDICGAKLCEINSMSSRVEMIRLLDNATAALRSRLAQPEQEPFAYSYLGIKANGEQHGPHLTWKPEYMDAMSASMGAVAVPLYTTPPQRKPLTDEEIETCRQQGYDHSGLSASFDFVKASRAIEAAHDIKEEA